MPNEMFRFIHATGLHLDQPLLATGALSGEERHLVEDATLRAFGNLIDACLEERPDFLLLTGDSFDAQTQSLRARRALESGFARLAEHDLPVVIVPGGIDPASAWRKLKLPGQVTLLVDGDAPLKLSRDGRPFAVLFPVATAESSESTPRRAAIGKGKSGFRIGIVGAGTPIEFEGNAVRPAEGGSKTVVTAVQTAISGGCDYLALGSGVRGTLKFKQCSGHCPGDLQPLNPDASGAHGFSIVEVRDGSCQSRLIPVAPVRYEDLSVEVSAELTLEALVEKMSLALLDIEAFPNEELWLIRWTLRGNGGLFASLADRKRQEDLGDAINRELGSSGGPRRQHQLIRQPQAAVSDSRDEGPHQLLLDYLEQVESGLMPAIEAFRRDAQSADWPQAPWSRHVKLAVQRLKPQAVAEQTRIIGLGALT